MYRYQVLFESVNSVETGLKGRACPWAKFAYHRTLVVAKGVANLVVLSCKPLSVKFTTPHRTSERPFGLMCQEVGL
jgi:hypothetical protein